MASKLQCALETVLTPDLLKPEWRKRVNAHPLAGHCYVACEVLYHLSGKVLRPHVVRHEGGTHWFLRDAQGNVVDPTAAQFKTPVPYDKGRGCGFLTKAPSKRAVYVLARIFARSLGRHSDA